MLNNHYGETSVPSVDTKVVFIIQTSVEILPENVGFLLEEGSHNSVVDITLHFQLWLWVQKVRISLQIALKDVE